MPFSITSSNQAEDFILHFKSSMYGKLNEWSKKTVFIRLTGLPVGIISSASNIIISIVSIAENIIKAIANIFGALLNTVCNTKCLQSCSLLKGLKQLVINPLPHLIWLFSIAITLGTIPIICNTVGILIMPQSCTKMCKENFMPWYKWDEKINNIRTQAKKIDLQNNAHSAGNNFQHIYPYAEANRNKDNAEQRIKNLISNRRGVSYFF